MTLLPKFLLSRWSEVVQKVGFLKKVSFRVFILVQKVRLDAALGPGLSLTVNGWNSCLRTG